MAAVGVVRVLVAVVPAAVAPVRARAGALEPVVVAAAVVAAGEAVVPAAVAVEALAGVAALEPVAVERAAEQQAASLDTAVAHLAALRASGKVTLRALRPALLMLLA